MFFIQALAPSGKSAVQWPGRRHRKFSDSAIECNGLDPLSETQKQRTPHPRGQPVTTRRFQSERRWRQAVWRWPTERFIEDRAERRAFPAPTRELLLPPATAFR